MVFSFNEHEKFKSTREIPAELIRYLLPGSQASAISNEYLKLLLQEFYSAHCKVFYAVYLVDKKTSFRLRGDGPLFFFCLALQHDRYLEIAGLGKVLIKEGQFNMIYAPLLDLVSAHEDGREYITLNLQYDLNVLQEWAPYFPKLAAFLEKVQAGKPAALLSPPEWLTKEIQDIIYRIMHTPSDTASWQPYFDLLLKTLLFHLLNQSVQRLPASIYTHYEIDGIQAARIMIKKNIRYHFVIREISQKVGMNEFKLKNGFRELFGNGVYEYLRTERMLEARHLLSNGGKNVKEVAALTGYKSVNSFIKAFKKKYGQTPGDYRKRA
jgi:AraC family transcriptional regulator, transcriptional activator of the genes for pyochelin and ferripyochelin receptors